MGHDLLFHQPDETACDDLNRSTIQQLHLGLGQETLVNHGFSSITYSHSHGTKANAAFSWKAIIKQEPYKLLGIMIFVSVLVLGFLIRNLERYVQFS